MRTLQATAEPRRAFGFRFAGLIWRGPALVSLLSWLVAGWVASVAGSAPALAGWEGQALILAASRGDVPAIRNLVESGADLHARDERGRNAVLAAVQGSHLEAASLLITLGADVDAQDDIQDSAFLLAGARGHAGIVRQALDAGADVTATNRYGGTALIPACHYGHVETVRVLLTSRIAVDHVNRLGWTALLEAIILGNGGPRYVQIVEMLLARGANPNRADQDGVSLLAHARLRQQDRVVARLLAAGARDIERAPRRSAG